MTREAAANLKSKLAVCILDDLDPDIIREQLGADRVEVDMLGPLQAQVKVWPASGGAPRYFAVRLSELV